MRASRNSSPSCGPDESSRWSATPVTPLLSDPGYALVRAAVAAGIPVRAIPGPSALTAALSVAGLPTDRFVFEGFLPARATARRTRLAALSGEPRTLVFFEAPHRIADLLADIAVLFGSHRSVAIARELTKVHETIHRGTVEQLQRELLTDPNLGRGEITVVVEGAGDSGAAGPDVAEEVGRGRGRRRTQRSRLVYRPRRGICWRGRCGCCWLSCHPPALPPLPRSWRACPGGRHTVWRSACGLPKRLSGPPEAGIVTPRRVGQAVAVGGGNNLSDVPWRKVRARRAGCQVTPGGREPTESATENRPPKRWKRRR